MFAGGELQDWTPLSALPLTAHAVMVRNIYSTLEYSTPKLVILSNHKALTGGVSEHKLLMLIPQQLSVYIHYLSLLGPFSEGPLGTPHLITFTKGI